MQTAISLRRRRKEAGRGEGRTAWWQGAREKNERRTVEGHERPSGTDEVGLNCHGGRNWLAFGVVRAFLEQPNA
jgi:hypothetical protein